MITPDGVRAAPRGGSSLATALGIMDPMRVGGEKDGRHGGWMLPAAIRRAIALGLGVYVEAGHVVFGPFGEVLGTLGGTLLQLFFPLAFLVYFWRRAQRLEAGVCGVWAAENGMYTAEYMADAQAQMLPLVGGHIHDWNWLLGRAGILGACEELGALLHVIASASAISAVWLVARETSLTPRPRARPQTR
jgi:hypothetical protein